MSDELILIFSPLPVAVNKDPLNVKFASPFIVEPPVAVST